MKGLYAIYRKEMGHYFVSPVAYIIVGVFLLLCAFFFTRLLTAVIEQSLEASMSGGGMPLDVPSIVVRYFFGTVSTLLLFLTPMLTMGVYSEERKRGTMELLMTSPLTDTQIVMGKFLASLTLLIIMLVPTFLYNAYVFLHSEPAAPWHILFTAYLGIFLLGAALLALGSFFSSLTESQIIASILTFGGILLLWVVDYGTPGTGGVAAVLQYLSIFRHFDDFTRGVIDTTGLIFYASFIFLGLFLTVRSLDSMRWRRA
jgi:ABC-2 type transport system permease protein